MATLLATIQEVCRRQGIDVPATIFGSTDRQVVQLYTLLQEGLDDLSGRGVWEELTFEASWTTTNTEDQGALATRADKGLRWLLPQTFWDRTEKLPLLGPLDAQDWQALKAIVITGPRYSFRIRQGRIIVTPAPPAGHTWVFEYVATSYLTDAGGTIYKKRFTADTDLILLPDDIVQMDLRWRWKKEKGLSYAEDFKSAERLINDAVGRSGSKPILWMDMRNQSPQPGVFIPAGNWMQP
jgi:hypothetical protein